MLTRTNFLKKCAACAFLLLALTQFSGCIHRTEDDFDDRTLAQRSHVETVKPEDRKDIFRP